MLDPAILEQGYSYFLTEAQELLQTIEQDLLHLRVDHTPARVHSLMRAAHTLKGAAASVGAVGIKTISHSLEDVFKALYVPEVVIDPELEALLFEGYECLRLPIAAAIAQTHCDDTEVLNRANAVVAKLKAKLGDQFNPQAAIPTSAELGFDITQSLFETGVNERLEQLETVLASQEVTAIAQTLQAQAEVFIGLAESLNLPGFGTIAQTTLAALTAQPDQVISITQLALRDLRAGQTAVLSGDRIRGGEPSAELQQLAGRTSGASQGTLARFKLTDTWNRLVQFLNQPIRLDSPPAPTSQLSSSPVVTTEDTDLIDFNQILIEAESIDSLLPSDSATAIEPSFSNFETLLNPLETLMDEADSITAEAFLELNSAAPTPSTNSAALEKQNTGAAPDETTQSQPEPLVKDVLALPTTVRVKLQHLESLNHSVSELLINQNRQALQEDHLQTMVQELSARLQQQQQTLDSLRDWCDRTLITAEVPLVTTNSAAQPAHNSLTNHFDSLELDRYSELHLRLQSALEELAQLNTIVSSIDLSAQQSRQSVDKQGRLLTNIRDDLMAARMVPISEIFNRFPRLLQQLISIYDKPAELYLKGTQVLVDKAVAEKLFDPLLHLVRNAFDHGLEPVEARQQLGKPTSGQIELAAYQQGNRTVIEVRDDGGGIDLEKICRRGYEQRRLASDQVDQFPKAELLNLLFEPGFSTASEVNDLSGRGVGLDVVRSQLRSLNGNVTIQSERHQGTVFTLHLPLTLMTARLTVCQAGQAVYALFSETIETILLPEPTQIVTQAGQRTFQWQRGEHEFLVPVYKISELVNYTTSLASSTSLATNNGNSLIVPVLQADRLPLLILPFDTGYLSLEVDQILGEQELVIRPLGSTIAAPSYVYGCSILGDGRLTLVLDGLTLARQQFGHEMATQFGPELTSLPVKPREPETPVVASSATCPRLLVVDDSITIRQTLTLTLQKAGYQVVQAQDGLEAIAQLQQYSDIGFVTCDVEMPRMNGFEFLTRYKQEPALAHIPVVMLTSRSSEKHRQLAQELGAAAYMTKPYVEHEIIAMVHQFVPPVVK